MPYQNSAPITAILMQTGDASSLTVTLVSEASNIVKATVKNIGASDITAIIRNTVLDSRPTRKLTVSPSADTDDPEFIGACYKFSWTTIPAGDTILIPAGQSVAKEINVAELYQFPSSVGTSSYEFIAQNTVNILSADGTYQGESHEIIGKVTAVVDQALAARTTRRTIAKRTNLTEDCKTAQTPPLQ